MSYPALNPYRHSRLVERAALAVAAAVLLAIALPVHAEDNTYVVKTTAGKVRGVARAKGGAEFLGIPYAEPPVGRLRWRAPVAKKKWSGIHDANAFGASCTQPDLGDWNRHDAETGQEDCLYINVIAPAWQAKGPLPVMMWIHGGANLGGSGSGSFYTDGTLLDRGVLIVTINYRLDVFGFFAHPAYHESSRRASGNYGLLDQILALRWVHSNIARFGGDPNNVTVFGQSAGSMNIGMLIASPLARGLFEKAIGESGSPLYPAPMPRTRPRRPARISPRSSPSPRGPIPSNFSAMCLPGTSSPKLRRSSGAMPRGAPMWTDMCSQFARRDLSVGPGGPIPLLLGVTSASSAMRRPQANLTKEMECATGKFAPRALALYRLADGGQGSSDPVYGSVGIQWEADYDFHCPVTTEALWHSAAHNPTYLYEFDHPIPGQEAQAAAFVRVALRIR